MPNLASFISIKLKRIKANRVDRRQQKMPDLWVTVSTILARVPCPLSFCICQQRQTCYRYIRWGITLMWALWSVLHYTPLYSTVKITRFYHVATMLKTNYCFTAGRQVCKHLKWNIFLVFRERTVIEIGPLLTELFSRNSRERGVFGTQCCNEIYKLATKYVYIEDRPEFATYYYYRRHLLIIISNILPAAFASGHKITKSYFRMSTPWRHRRATDSLSQQSPI